MKHRVYVITLSINPRPLSALELGSILQAMTKTQFDNLLISEGLAHDDYLNWPRNVLLFTLDTKSVFPDRAFLALIIQDLFA